MLCFATLSLMCYFSESAATLTLSSTHLPVSTLITAILPSLTLPHSFPIPPHQLPYPFRPLPQYSPPPTCLPPHPKLLRTPSSSPTHPLPNPPPTRNENLHNNRPSDPHPLPTLLPRHPLPLHLPLCALRLITIYHPPTSPHSSPLSSPLA